MNLPIRPRRLRLQPQLRTMLQGVSLRRADNIVPIFVPEGSGQPNQVPSKPGIIQMTVDLAQDWHQRRSDEGFGAYLVFGVIDSKKKDAQASAALDPQNVVCQLLQSADRAKLPMAGITDLCFC